MPTLKRNPTANFDFQHRPHPPKGGTPAKGTKPTGGRMSEQWQRIREARRFANLRQEDLAQATGKTRGAVAMWESINASIRTSPQLEDVRTIARTCKVPLAYLLEDKYTVSDLHRMVDSSGVVSEPVNEPVFAAPPRPNTSLIGMDVRNAQGFWSAVEFDACERRSQLRECFTGLSGARPDFVHNENVAVFTCLGQDARALLVGAMAILLQAEREAGHAMRKHVLVYRNGGAAVLDAQEAARQFGADVRVFETPAAASKYLQSL